MDSVALRGSRVKMVWKGEGEKCQKKRPVASSNMKWCINVKPLENSQELQRLKRHQVESKGQDSAKDGSLTMSITEVESLHRCKMDFTARDLIAMLTKGFAFEYWRFDSWLLSCNKSEPMAEISLNKLLEAQAFR